MTVSVEEKRISVRAAGRQDVPALLTMIAALAAHHGDAARIDAQGLQDALFGPQAWARVALAEIDGRPVGYAALRVTGLLHFARRGLDLHHLYVAPAHRGQGVGRALVAHAEALGRSLGCEHLLVSADPANWQARRAYERMGFVSRTVQAAHYGKAL
ncbi:aminoalkylphosphonic acid N-acetyltransferase [Pseudoruegeria aquimaris]|uniref:Aminoalkylphosphonic acid N-acetyltransferase n=1 Tax=Pseudoruegeria aquimaris TaxID=393663 RepID=A0A1Y5ST26_9RHOB|nr:GNAT family N-acetyltransferase [Pseudoruegeria aquimaris]SLN45868.1 aminoalkylphosphonic acid N-acetyltransferase [Pseudoruegeria aquimaris]